MARGDQGAVPSVEPYFDQILALLLEIVRLEIVDDGKVVNVASTRRNVPVLVALVLLVELPNQLLCLY